MADHPHVIDARVTEHNGQGPKDYALRAAPWWDAATNEQVLPLTDGTDHRIPAHMIAALSTAPVRKGNQL